MSLFFFERELSLAQYYFSSYIFFFRNTYLEELLSLTCKVSQLLLNGVDN